MLRKCSREGSRGKEITISIAVQPWANTRAYTVLSQTNEENLRYLWIGE